MATKKIGSALLGGVAAGTTETSTVVPAPVRSKAERMVQKLFADDRERRYAAKRGSYSAVPWVFRRALDLFSVREWQLLSYLYLRSGPESVVWMHDKQIAIDLGVSYRKIAPNLKALIAKGFVQAAEHDGTRYLLLLDPEQAIRKLAARGEVNDRMLEALKDDFEVIGLATLEGPKS